MNKRVMVNLVERAEDTLLQFSTTNKEDKKILDQLALAVQVAREELMKASGL